MFYRLRNENRKVKADIHGLYNACIAINGVEGGLVLNSHNELIAFYCSYDNKVKAGYAAHDLQKRDILNFDLAPLRGC